MIKILISIFTVILVYFSAKITQDSGVKLLNTPEQKTLVTISPDIKIIVPPADKTEIEKQELKLNSNKKCSDSNTEIVIVDFILNSQIYAEPIVAHKILGGGIAKSGKYLTKTRDGQPSRPRHCCHEPSSRRCYERSDSYFCFGGKKHDNY